MIYITRRERFNAAHKLNNTAWSEEKNLAVFGKCSNPNWHGHNYELFVTVKGIPDPETGFVFNLKLLSEILKEKVVDKIDHRNINLEVDFMKSVIPSTELLAKGIWNEINDEINSHGVQLHSVKLHETENNYVEYFGD